jgi:predicted DNA-binding transcriptional regulator YafY
MTQRAVRYKSLDRTVDVLTALMRGDELDRASIARMGKVKLATADRQIAVLAKCPGVVEAKRGRRKVLRFDPSTCSPPPAFPEVVAACLGTSLSRVFEGSAYERSMKSALTYLLARARREGLFQNIDRKFLFVARGGEVAFPERSGDLDDLVDAVLHSYTVTVQYRRFEGNEQSLKIQPLSIAIYDHQLYVIAADANGQPHPFRFARMGSVTAHKAESFGYPSRVQYDPDQVFRDSFGIFISDTYPVRDVSVRLSTQWASYAQSHRWHKSQRVELNSDGSATVSIRVKTCPELEMWILSFGEHAEVLRPPELRKRVAQRIQAMTRVYDENRQLTLL